ncbi:cytosolic non-specific dipeptidase 2 [Arctopsyche grandis]|uniref:cytosolic non-specific dipeptidase 2 n=1 Tax=Arctopsyche grandis TaxID=121162 RepID=UPI00406D8677
MSYLKFKKIIMSLPGPLPTVFDQVDKNKTKFIEVLREAVAIKSISTDVTCRDECTKMVLWTKKKLEALGATVELKNIGTHVIDGKTYPLPDVIVGYLGNDPKKKTTCIYGHLDVQPANLSDGWLTEPFELVEKDGKLFGRGSTDDKGPVLCWLHAIESYQNCGIDIPVNIKFVFEAMEESGSEGLDELLYDVLKPSGFFNDVDFVCISDNYWLGTTKPCITYGLRGMCYFFVEVECAAQDLHSGVMGGTVHESMADVVYLLNSLVDKDGKIIITNLYKEVAPIFDGEKEMYENIEFDPIEYKKSLGAHGLAHNGDKIQLLMYRWRYPSLSIHGIQGAVWEPGTKTVIPGKVIGKFSIRIVPDQEPEVIGKYVVDYLNAKWAERGSPNRMKAHMVHSGRPWTADPKHEHYAAAARATKHVFKIEPDMCREGGSIPVTISLQEASGKNVMLLPVGAGDDMAHSQNEKINVKNYIEGTKLLAAYLYEVGLLK